MKRALGSLRLPVLMLSNLLEAFIFSAELVLSEPLTGKYVICLFIIIFFAKA
jgi:hypothetical protein